MTHYVTNDLAFDLDEAFLDRTIHDLAAPLPGPERRVFSLLIDRAPVAPSTPFADAVKARVREDALRLSRHEVLDVRPVRAQDREATGVVFQWRDRGAAHYARQLHVLGSGMHICFSATAPLSHKADCDEYFDHLIDTLELHPGESDG